MNKIKMTVAAATCAVMVSGVALAAGMFGNWPIAGTSPYTATLPLMGTEHLATDTGLPSGVNPASEILQLQQVLQGTSATDSTATSHTAAAATECCAAKLTTLLTGAPAVAVTLTTRTAALWFADAAAAWTLQPLAAGQTYLWKIVNVGGTASGVWTVAGGTGVTITGNATVAVAGSRCYLVTLTSASAVGLQDEGNGC